MKKKWLYVVNICIIIVILSFVFLYSYFDRKRDYDNQVVNFENMTVAMEHVTENYLQGEQGICDVWATYITGRDMTLQEATDFIKASHVLQNTSAHLIYTDTLKGLSTRPSPSDPEKYAVSYVNVDIFGNMEWISDVGKNINISRAYTNPMNGKQSLAFLNKITVYDEETSAVRDALLLRIVPLSDLKEKWVFPQTEFKNAELSIINADGDFIIKGSSFDSKNFYEFYSSYNKVGNAALQELKDRVGSTTSSFIMKDSKKQSCLIAHTPVEVSNGWVMINYINESSLSTKTENWILIGVIMIGLLLLLAINTFYMRLVNKRLHQMAKEAESANRAKTDFLSTMSHDIRTPMNAIIGLTAISEQKINDSKTVKENLRKISLASNHLLTLINDILDISKVESGRLSLNPITFSIVDVVQNLVNISHPSIKEKNIDFRFRVEHMEKEYFYADQLRLNQIYINILSNAVKYTQPGGTITVNIKETPSDRPGYAGLVYSVEDSGMGMSPEFMRVMYQPFLRQTDSRVNSIQGTGLGLTITKKMVDLMGGSIDCESEVGKGTTFTVTLELPVADKQYDDLKLDPIEVLVVDDDEVLLETASGTLESLGVRAERAQSGAEALELVKKRQAEGKNYDVIIIDWKMAGMDGVETARHIRSDVADAIPILLISAYDWSDVEASAKDVGVNGFIGKPLFRSTLYEKISELLGVEAKGIEPREDYSDIAGLKVLVAEDNDINWEIIHSMLEMFGVDSDRAANGRICIEMLNEADDGKYDLVFMDVQMPEMNGLDATRLIRASENKRISDIPIIAMTADAFSENVAECLKAGMNGHLAKPVDIKLVIKEIRRIKEKKQ